MTKRYFDILGIPPTKNKTVIKKAYRKKALKYHPDRNPSESAKDKFIKVTKAYDSIILAIENAQSPLKNKRRPTQQAQRKASATQATREEIIKEAEKRYQQMKRKEAQDEELYYQKISSGEIWKKFMSLMYICTFLSLLITIDLFVLPTQIQANQIIKKNIKVTYSGPEEGGTSPVVFDNGQKAYISLAFISLEQSNTLYLERTLLFKDIKYVKIQENNGWRKYVPDYTVVSTFPLIPLVLLIPLLTFFLKGRTVTFSILFHTAFYGMPIFLTFLLLSNDRWLHLITLGLL